MRDFRTLQVWHKGHELTLAIYAATALFPRDELYGLTSQMRRSSASIPTNIAEGCGRDGDAEHGRFLRIPMGSSSELEYQLLLARDLQMLEQGRFDSLTKQVTEVKRMLTSLGQRLKADS